MTKAADTDSPYSLRPSTAEDRPVLIRFMAALQDVEHALHPDRPPGTETAEAHFEYLRKECAENQGQFLIAEDRYGASVGFILFMVDDFGGHYVHPDHRHVGWVSDIWIEPEHRGQGILDMMFAAAEDHFRALGITRLMLAHLKGNDTARDAYLRRGFTAYETILERKIS